MWCEWVSVMVVNTYRYTLGRGFGKQQRVLALASDSPASAFCAIGLSKKPPRAWVQKRREGILTE